MSLFAFNFEGYLGQIKKVITENSKSNVFISRLLLPLLEVVKNGDFLALFGHPVQKQDILWDCKDINKNIWLEFSSIDFFIFAQWPKRLKAKTDKILGQYASSWHFWPLTICVLFWRDGFTPILYTNFLQNTSEFSVSYYLRGVTTSNEWNNQFNSFVGYPTNPVPTLYY